MYMYSIVHKKYQITNTASLSPSCPTLHIYCLYIIIYMYIPPATQVTWCTHDGCVCVCVGARRLMTQVNNKQHVVHVLLMHIHVL